MAGHLRITFLHEGAKDEEGHRNRPQVAEESAHTYPARTALIHGCSRRVIHYNALQLRFTRGKTQTDWMASE